MRDPKRIPRIMSDLHRLWRSMPDVRLTQLIANLTTGLPGYQHPNDSYNVEDDELEKALQLMLKN